MQKRFFNETDLWLQLIVVLWADNYRTPKYLLSSALDHFLEQRHKGDKEWRSSHAA